jgi:drug/metabolite transporter (DMT)-like permease
MLQNIDFTDPVVQILSVLVGIAVLFLGRRLFWLFVAAVGFILGLALAIDLLPQLPDWVILVAALVFGLVGALIAVIAQRVAIIIAGFFMGGYALLWLLQLFSLNPDRLDWLIFIVGGIIGAILVQFLFDAALIVLSALAGATLIAQVTNFSPPVTAVLFVVLLVLGIIVQAQMWREGWST